MKYTTIIASLSVGLTTLLSTGCVDPGYVTATVSTSSYDGDDTGHDFRRKVHHLREHYARVRDEAEQSKDLGRLAMQDNGSRGDWPC